MVSQSLNIRLIVLSGIMTTLAGTVVGVAVAKIRPCPYISQMYQGLEQKYAIAGAAGGLLLGSAQGVIWQLKKRRDEEAVGHSTEQQ